MQFPFSHQKGTATTSASLGQRDPASLKNDELTVVELFQSQGCSSCPPTNSHVLALTEDPRILVLTYDVTYWDHLGWTDTFGNSAFDARQRAYARSLQGGNAYTPQVIVNGRVDGVGNTAKELHSLLSSGSSEKVVVVEEAEPRRRVTVTGPTDMSAVVNLVRYDSAQRDVAIARGENGGRTLAHRNVVCEVVRLGRWQGGVEHFHLPPAAGDGHLQTAILVQSSDAGSIVGAARI